MSLNDQINISRTRTIRASNVLVLYRQSDPVGQSIAYYYQARRSIPGDNIVSVPTSIFPSWSFDPNAADYNQATVLNWADVSASKAAMQVFATWLCNTHLATKQIKAIVTAGEWPMGWYPGSWTISSGINKTAVSLAEVLSWPWYWKDNFPADSSNPSVWGGFMLTFGGTPMRAQIGDLSQYAPVSPILNQFAISATNIALLGTYPINAYSSIAQNASDVAKGVRYLHCRLECGRDDPGGTTGITRVRRMIDDAVAVEGQWTTLLPVAFYGYANSTYKPASYGLNEILTQYGQVPGIYWESINNEGVITMSPTNNLPGTVPDLYPPFDSAWTKPLDRFRFMVLASNSGSVGIDSTNYNIAQGAIGLFHPSFGGTPVASVSANVELAPISILRADQSAAVQAGTEDVFNVAKNIILRTQGISPAHKIKVTLQYVPGAGTTSVLSCAADGTITWLVDGVTQKTITPGAIAWTTFARTYLPSLGLTYNTGPFKWVYDFSTNLFHTSLASWFIRSGGCVSVGADQEPTTLGGSVTDALPTVLLSGLALGDWWPHNIWVMSPVDVYGDPLYRPFSGAIQRTIKGGVPFAHSRHKWY